MQAIVLLSTFHFLACVCHSFGVATEPDILWTPGASFFSVSALGTGEMVDLGEVAWPTREGTVDGAFVGCDDLCVFFISRDR